MCDVHLRQLAVKLGLRKMRSNKDVCETFDTVYHGCNQVWELKTDPTTCYLFAPDACPTHSKRIKGLARFPVNDLPLFRPSAILLQEDLQPRETKEFEEKSAIRVEDLFL